MRQNGIHHVTAIAGDARRNLGFYAGTLGLRLVKKTVNFDDPGTYHLYYGDEAGRPGTILTFFPWAHAAPGRLGTGETQETVFRVAEGAIGYWVHRFVQQGVPHEAIEKRFGETVNRLPGFRWHAARACGRSRRRGRTRLERRRRFRQSTRSEGSIV